MKPILHITSAKINKKKFELLGSMKDVNSRIEYFDNRNFIVDRISCNMSIREIRENLKYVKSENYSDVIIEHSPNILIQLYLFFKFGKIIYRSHNAEFYHRSHIFYYELIHLLKGITLKNKKFSIRFFFSTFYSLFRSFINILRFMTRDISTSILAKKIIANCEWEKKNYFDYIAKKKTLSATPFLSGLYLKKINNNQKKENIIIISGSNFPNPISYEQILRCEVLKEIKKNYEVLFNKFKFIITGKITNGIMKYLIKKEINQIKNLFFYHDRSFLVKSKELRNFETNINSYPLSEFNNISYNEFKSYYDLLSVSKAMMFCTSAGYGFKNKALEAYAHKIKLILPNKISKRFPDELESVIYSYKKLSDFEFIFSNLLNENNFPSEDLNGLLRKKSFNSYDISLDYKND